MKKVLCMEIENNSIRCIETGTDKKISFKTDFELGREIPDKESVQKFKTVLQNEGITAKSVVILPHLANTIERNIETPLLKQDELLKYLELNSRDYFPISVTDYVMSANILHKEVDKMNVSVTLLLKKNIEIFQKTLKLLGFWDIKLSLGCPPFEKEPSEKYVAISMFGNELTLRYFKDGQAVYLRSELIETTEDVNGIFVRFDDNISEQFGSSFDDIPVYVFGDNKNVLESKLKTLFNVSFENIQGYDYTYDYLKGLASWVKKGKITSSKVASLEDDEKSKKELIKLISIISSGVVIGAIVFYNCYAKPLADLQKLHESYLELETKLEDSLGQGSQVVSNDLVGVYENLNTYNNNFFVFIDELKEEMPSSFVINNITISSESVNISVYLNSLESCSVALYKMNNLEYSDRGDVSSITQSGEGYTFSVTLYYKNSLKY